MSPNPHSGRFDPRWLFPEIETDEAELFEAPDAFPFPAAEESTTDPAGRDFDEALEQIVSNGCRVCPLSERLWRATSGRLRPQSPARLALSMFRRLATTRPSRMSGLNEVKACG
jgi:hypothetical protein